MLWLVYSWKKKKNTDKKHCIYITMQTDEQRVCMLSINRHNIILTLKEKPELPSVTIVSISAHTHENTFTCMHISQIKCCLFFFSSIIKFPLFVISSNTFIAFSLNFLLSFIWLFAPLWVYWDFKAAIKHTFSILPFLKWI